MRGALGRCETFPIVVSDEMFVCRESLLELSGHALLHGPQPLPAKGPSVLIVLDLVALHDQGLSTEVTVAI